MHVDYAFLRNCEGDEKSTVLVGRCRESKMLLAHVVPSEGGSEDRVLDEIVKEVNTMCKFQHENIVQYLGCQKGPRPTQFFIFLENMPGGSLEGYLKRVGCPPRELLRSYTRQMCSALKYLHRNEVLHRDVKAGNVLLDHTLKVVKLADFAGRFA